MTPRHPEAVERLRARDLVHEVEVDVEQVGLAFAGVDDVPVPDLLGERAHRRPSVQEGGRAVDPEFRMSALSSV